MMDPITYALNQVKFNIPVQILVDAFIHTSGHQNEELDFAIMSDVIYSRVIPDTEILGGVLKDIRLRPEWYEPLNSDIDRTQSGIYRVPPSARDNADIVGVVNASIVNIRSSNPGALYNQGGTTVPIMEHKVLQSHTYSNIPNMPIPKIRFGNLIQLIPDMPYNADIVVTCRLSYDRNMMNLPQSAILPFAALVVLATKAHIHNVLILRIDELAISRGREVGAVKDIIDRYEDANEQYLEKVQTFRSGAMMSKEQKLRLLEYML